MSKRPLEDKRPFGPVVSSEQHLMIGFPVQLPQQGSGRGISDNPLSEIEEDIARDFFVDRGDIKTDKVNLSGFDAPVVYFVSFPMKGEMDPTTARELERARPQIEEIVNEYTGKELAANVSVWVGDKRSGKDISGR